MTKWHAHVVHMAKHMNMVGVPFWWGALGPGPLSSPLNPALVRQEIAEVLFSIISKFFKFADFRHFYVAVES